MNKRIAILEIAISTMRVMVKQNTKVNRLKRAWLKRDRSEDRPIHHRYKQELIGLLLAPSLAAVQIQLIQSQPELPNFTKGGDIGESNEEFVFNARFMKDDKINHDLRSNVFNSINH